MPFLASIFVKSIGIIIIFMTIVIIIIIIAIIIGCIALQCTTGQSDFWPLFRGNLIRDDWGAFPQYQFYSFPNHKFWIFQNQNFNFNSNHLSGGCSLDIWRFQQKLIYLGVRPVFNIYQVLIAPVTILTNQSMNMTSKESPFAQKASSTWLLPPIFCLQLVPTGSSLFQFCPNWFGFPLLPIRPISSHHPSSLCLSTRELWK